MALANPSGTGSSGTGSLESLLTSALTGGNTMGNLFGQNDNTGSGLIGGLILGSLLRNNGNFLGNDGNGAYGNRHNCATPNDVQETVGFINTIQDINSARRDIFQSQGDLQASIAAASNSGQVQNLQSQIATLTAVNGAQDMLSNQIGAAQSAIASRIENVSSDVASLSTGVVAGVAGINQNIATANYQTAATVRDDGDKTRAAIAALAASIPNSRELDLQRQLTVALDNARDLETRGVIRSGNVDVTTVVNQNQAQAQQQQQLNTLLAGFNCLVNEVQRNTQSVVNLGTMTGSAGQQTAANTRVNS